VNTAQEIYESDDEGVVHVDVPVGRPGRRVEVLVVWSAVDESGDVDPGTADLIGLLEEGDLERHPQDAIGIDKSARLARLQRYATWTEEDLREFEIMLTAQRTAK
jgi:hypothetical protein